MRYLSCWCGLAGLAVLAACDGSSGPAGGPEGLTLTPVDSGYDFSVFLAAPPGDPSRLMIVERGGGSCSARTAPGRIRRS